MRHVTTFPHDIIEIPTLWIPMPDGRRLAARVWMPVDAESNPVPALLEYLPYRRRDGTTARDLLTHPWIAGHGYATIRLDIGGTGDSEGIIVDEYDLQEMADGAHAVEWIARQRWCSGSVGMWGISWGGFNALQVAALTPPALKAIIPIGFAHDRYEGDCHFMGGCMLEGNISWGHTFFAGNARPPDPESFGPEWRQEWLRRLDALEHPARIWLSHQTRDDYWKPGSVCEDYSRIRAAVYAVSGWQDSYSRNVLPLLDGLVSPKKALIGPWAHAWPHFANPGPQIGFLQEALRWWDHWLKGRDTGIMDEPMLRVWMQDDIPPAKQVRLWPGRWVQEEVWPRADEKTRYALTDGGLAEGHVEQELAVAVASPQAVGLMAGYQCSYGMNPDLSGDQRTDDEGSACFDTGPLAAALEILGEPAVELTVSCDRPEALLAVRLNSVAPDGASLRVCYGLLNLSHRDGPADPQPLEPSRRYRVTVPLMAIAQRFAPGQRIRIAISNAYWPIAWPSPEATRLTIHGGTLLLPVRASKAEDAALAPFAEPEGAAAATIIETRPRDPDQPLDAIITDPQTGVVSVLRSRDRGAWRTTDTDVDYDAQGLLRFAIHPDEPNSAVQDFSLTSTLGRDGWRTRTHAFTSIASTPTHFIFKARLEAYEGDDLVFSRDWSDRIPRVGSESVRKQG